MKILTLGPKGTYSNIAALKFNKNAEIFYADSLADVFGNFQKMKFDFLVTPVENTIHGTVREAFDNLYESDCKIYAAIDLPINHVLASKSTKFKIICSHEQALAQCRKFLVSKYKDYELKIVSSTAEAAVLASENEDCAAITNIETAKLYKLKVISENIEDFQNNKTKFWVIGRKFNEKKQKFTSMVIKPNSDASGILLKLLMPFNYLGINLTRLESRPMKGSNGEYLFYLDCEGDFRDKKLIELQKIFETGDLVKEFRIFGSY